jgi:hypothetical protein
MKINKNLTAIFLGGLLGGAVIKLGAVADKYILEPLREEFKAAEESYRNEFRNGVGPSPKEVIYVWESAHRKPNPLSNEGLARRLQYDVALEVLAEQKRAPSDQVR